MNEFCRTKICEANLTMEIAQLLLSLLHAWGLDLDLDRLCEATLGLLRPMIPVSFGVISKGGMYFFKSLYIYWFLFFLTIDGQFIYLF